jgi:hypothetical protein
MKVKCTFLAKNVSIKAFNGVTMLLFPPRIKKVAGRGCHGHVDSTHAPLVGWDALGERHPVDGFEGYSATCHCDLSKQDGNN